MEFDEVIKQRHSVKSFKQGKKPDYKDVVTAVEAASRAPLAGNHPALKYIIVNKKDKIKELASAAQQDFIEQVDWVIIICTDKKFLEKNYLDRSIMYARQQAGAAIEHILLKLTDLGLAGCWIGAFSEDMIKRIMALPAHLDVEAMIPVGYEQGKGKQKPRPTLDSMTFFNGYGDSYKFLVPKRLGKIMNV